jgi:hypothetical protein
MASENEELKPPAPAEIDAMIAEYAEAQRVATAARTASSVMQEAADKVKVRLVEMVETYGRRHTEKSKRLEGNHHKATTTTATCVVTDPVAIDELHGYLTKKDLVELEGKLFVKQVTYSLVASPDEVLRSVSLATRIRAKVTSLVKGCFKITTRAPSLKVDVAEVEKGKAA